MIRQKKDKKNFVCGCLSDSFAVRGKYMFQWICLCRAIS